MARRAASRSELTFPLGAWGRLGNQLFQIASTYGIARAQRRGVIFRRDWPYLPYFSLPDAWFGPRRVTARCSTAIPFINHIPPDYRVYMQDLELWHGHDQEIRRLLSPSAYAVAEATAMQPEVAAMKNKVAIHVRRGDYLNAGARHRPVPLPYYEQAVEEVKSQTSGVQFVVFSDDPDWARKNLPLADAFFVGGNPDWADLTLMALCEHHVCANSTFSWWGAFLADDPQPMYPWMPGVLPEHLHRIYPTNWREIIIEPSTQ